MNRTRFILIGGTILVFAMSLLLSNQGIAKDYRMINIFGTFGEPGAQTSLMPSETSVARNTTVIWFNQSTSDVKIIFREGRTCKLATDAATGWHLLEGCYITKDSIPIGGTSSAVFNNKGTFDYEVEYVGTNRKEKGSIRVW